jgi:hypothetical protein
MSTRSFRFTPALQVLDAREVPAVLFPSLPDVPSDAPTSAADVCVLNFDTTSTEGETGDSDGDSAKSNKKV